MHVEHVYDDWGGRAKKRVGRLAHERFRDQPLCVMVGSVAFSPAQSDIPGTVDPRGSFRVSAAEPETRHL